MTTPLEDALDAFLSSLPMRPNDMPDDQYTETLQRLLGVVEDTR